MKTAKPALLALFGAALISILPARAHGQTPAPPDFSIKSIRVDPAEPYSNSDVSIYVEVENVGSERVDNVQIVVNFSALFGGQAETTSLGPGETKTLSSRKYHPVPGTYEVKATLSSGVLANGLKEENKSNNVKTLVVQVREGRAPGTSADLALTDVTVGGSGGAYQLEATVRNIGVDPATCIFSISLVTEVMKGTRQVMKREDVAVPANQAFPPGAIKKMGPIPVVDKDHPGSLEDGTYDMMIGVYNKAGTFVEEVDRQNNYYRGTFMVGKGGTEPPPDFSIRSIRIDPAEPSANSDMNISVEVENVGRERVDNVQVVVNFNALFGGQAETVSLRPGETKILTSRKYHPAPGNYEVKATLGLGVLANGFKEENKANNEKTIAFQVREGMAPGTNADLALTDVKIGDAGGAYQLEAVVRNIGVDPASSVFSISLVTEVMKGTRQVMKREDVVIPANQPFAPGAVKKMGPIPITDKDRPGALEEGAYDVKIGVTNTAGTYMEEIGRQNNFYQGTFTVAKREAAQTVPGGIKTPKTPVRQVVADYFTAAPLEIMTGGEVRLKWSFPAAAEAALVIDGKTIPLQVPAGEMTVKPSCDLKTVSFCYDTIRIVGKTKNNLRLEREVKIKINKR